MSAANEKNKKEFHAFYDSSIAHVFISWNSPLDLENELIHARISGSSVKMEKNLFEWIQLYFQESVFITKTMLHARSESSLLPIIMSSEGAARWPRA